MTGLGPRVGGAHVGVNLKFDEKSLDKVGKQIHQQLKRAADQNRKVYQAIGRDAVTAWRAALGSIVTGAPLIGSAFSGAAGAATLLSGAVYSLAQTSFGLYGVLGSLAIAAGTARLGFEGFGDAVKATDPEKLAAALKNLSPNAQAAALAVRSLRDEFDDMRLAVQDRMFAGLDDDISNLSGTLFPVMQRGLVKMSGALNRMFGSLLKYANSKSGLEQISGVLDNSAEIFNRLQKSAVPFLDGALRLFNALAPAGKRLADRITEVAENFQSWTQAEGFGKRMNDMMLRAEKTGGLLLAVLNNLGGAISNVFGAANPATNMFLQMLVDVTQRFQDWTASIGGQDAIAKWATDAVAIMSQFGKTMGAVFRVVSELADPRVIISFLTTVENAFNILGQLPLDKMVSAFVKIAEALQPVSSAFLAIIIGGAALNIMLGSLIGQFGGLFSVLSNIVKFKILTNILKGAGGGANAAGGAAAGAAKKTGLLSRAWAFLLKIISKVRGAFSGVVGFFTKTGKSTGQVATKASKLSGAFKPVMGILARFAKFAGPVGLAVWIGSIIAKSEDLQKKLGEAWDAIKEAGSALMDAFAEIGTALKPLAPVADAAGSAFSKVFDVMDQLVGLGIGLVIDTITLAFKSLANVFRGAGSIIAGVITALTGLFTWDFSKMMEGLKQIGSGIIPLLKGLLGLFVTFFAPARLLKIGAGALKGLGGGISKAMPGILSTVGKFIGKFLKFFIALPATLIRLGGSAIVSLGKAIAKAAPKVLSAAGKIVVEVVKWIGRLPGRLMALGRAAVTKLGSAMSTGVSLLGRIAGRIATAVMNGLKALPGQLVNFGKRIITGLSGAISGAIGLVKTAAGKIKPAITGAFSGAATWLKQIGTNIIQGLGAGIDAARTWLKGKIDDLSGWIPGWIKDKLGIRSPSKVMAELAKWIPAGIAQGILRGIPGVEAAIDSAIAVIRNGMEEISLGKAASVVADTFNTVNERISTSFEKQLDRRNKAADKRFERMRVAILRKRRGSGSPGTGDSEKDSAAAKAASKREQSRVQKHLDALAEKRENFNKALAKKAKNAQDIVERIAERGRKAAMELGQAWDAQALALDNIQQTIEDAKSALTASKETFDSLLEGVRDSFKKNIFEAGSNGDVPPTFASMIENLENQKKAAEEFASTFARLRELGLNEESLRQFAEQGQEGLQAALTLLNEGGADGIAKVNELQKAVSDKAQEAGTLVANTLEGASVAAAEALVAQLLADEQIIKDEMTRLGEAMADAFKEAIASTVIPPKGGGNGSGGGGGGGREKNKPHAWEPKGKSQKCAICGRSRGNKIHTNRNNNNATGTNNYPGGWGLLGEFGPEFVRMPAGSQVRSASRSERMMRRQDAPQQPVTVNQNYYGPQTGSEKLRELEWTLRYAAGKRR